MFLRAELDQRLQTTNLRVIIKPVTSSTVIYPPSERKIWLRNYGTVL